MMTTEELKQCFEDNMEGEFLQFERVEAKRSRRGDIHAFLVLDELLPVSKYGRMIDGAEHDQIWLEVETETLAAIATPELVRDLVRCGIMLDEDTDSLSMFR